MSKDELVERLTAQSSGEVQQMDAEELLFYIEYLNGHQKQWKREALLRLAMHFTPRQALADHRGEPHDYTDFDSEKEPYQMITDYLRENHCISESDAKVIGQLLGQVWYDWFEERGNLTGRKREALKSKLKREQNNRCRNCGVKLGDQKNSLAFDGDDHFKPIHAFTPSQMEGEIDHIEPVSQFGGNKPDNFQLLCRFCNQGKKDDVMISLRDRLEIAYKKTDNIDPSTRRSLFYEVSSKYDECVRCGTEVGEVEITIRKQFKEGSLTASNLQMVCAECID